MTYFSVNAIEPVERYLAKRTNRIKFNINELWNVYTKKWPKYTLVSLVGLVFVLNVNYLTRKLDARQTTLKTTFNFSNASTKLPYPGIRICVPQIFRFSYLSDREIQFFFRAQTPNETNALPHWSPKLSTVVLHLKINGESTNTNSFFRRTHYGPYRVCWQSDKHAYRSGFFDPSSKIEMIINVAEYDDIVHANSPYLRHVEVNPFDEGRGEDPATINAFYLSPGRHSLIRLETIMEDSTIRPLTSVACKPRVLFDHCGDLLQRKFIRPACTTNHSLQTTVTNMSVVDYVKCVVMTGNVGTNCGTPCTRTIFKSFKSEAKIKFSKNLRNLEMDPTKTKVMHEDLKKAVELNSRYNDDFRESIIKPLPAFIDATRRMLFLLTMKKTLVCQRTPPRTIFQYQLPDVAEQFVQLKAASVSYWKLAHHYAEHNKQHVKQSVRHMIDAINSDGGQLHKKILYLSIGHNNEVLSLNPQYRRFFVTHSQLLAEGYEMETQIESIINMFLHSVKNNLNIRSTVLKTRSLRTSYLLTQMETSFLQAVNKFRSCHDGSGLYVPFTNNWQITGEKYVLINGTQLYDERAAKESVSNMRNSLVFSKTTTAVRISVTHEIYHKVFVPFPVIYHCMFYKTISDYLEKNIGLDRQFSYANVNARHKIFPLYSLTVLNNILQSDDRWGMRYKVDDCEDESCACSIAVKGAFFYPIYLPTNATHSELLLAAKQHSFSNYMGTFYRETRIFRARIRKCVSESTTFYLSSQLFFNYYYENIVKPYGNSIAVVKNFAAEYNKVRKSLKLIRFQSLLKTYGLEKRIALLHKWLREVMNGSSFEQLFTFLDKKGKIIMGEVQLILADLEQAYDTIIVDFNRSWAALETVVYLTGSSRSTDQSYFFADIFNNTVRYVLQNEPMELRTLVVHMKRCLTQSMNQLDHSYIPLRKSMFSWLEKVNFFIWRAKRYVASKQISKQFLKNNIVIVSISYETLDIRFEKNHIEYTLSQYRADWGNMLGFYYGLEAFSALQVVTIVIAVLVKKLRGLRIRNKR